MTLVHTETGEVVSDLSADAARELTEQIATASSVVWQLIRSAYEGRAWIALGYGSWDDYTAQEFGSTRIQMPREERQATVLSLRESGLSVRAIASATGTSIGTVSRDIEAGVPNGTPDDGPTEPDIAPPQKTTGTDGKSYQQTRQPDVEPAPKAGNPMKERVEELREHDEEIHAEHVSGKFTEALVAFVNIARKLDPEDVARNTPTGRDGTRIERLLAETETFIAAYRATTATVTNLRSVDQ